MRPTVSAIPFASLFLLMACNAAHDAPAGTSPTERDSAGVRIVENPAATGLPHWTVDTVASMSVGMTGDPAQEFGDIGGVAQLKNGMIVVLDGRGETAFEFRIFDSTGKHVGTYGRLGEGPGDFTWVNHFGSTQGDTIAAVDFPNRRLNYLTASRGYFRSLSLDEAALKGLIGADASGLTETLVPFSDSVYAIKAYRPRPGAQGPFGRMNSYHIVDLRTRKVTEIARFDEPRGKPIPALAGKRVSVYPVEAHEPVHVVDRERRRMCAGVTSIAEIQCVDDQGKRTIIRWHADSVPYTSADRAKVVDGMRASMLRGKYLPPADVDTYVGALEFPERYNPFAVLRIDASGNFWIHERARTASGGHELRFRILDPDGKQIAIANSFAPVRNVGLGGRDFFGGTAILRVFEDADGVPKVGLFAIHRTVE